MLKRDPQDKSSDLTSTRQTGFVLYRVLIHRSESNRFSSNVVSLLSYPSLDYKELRMTHD